MKKAIAFLLILAAVIALTGCSETETNSPETIGETAAATVVAELPAETTVQTQQTDGDPVLDAIVQEYGMPFRLWSATNEDMCEFTLYEGYADRVADRKEDNSYQEDRLSWEMEGDQLILSGEWSESFTIDSETMEAVSNDDGRVYRICAEQKIEE